MDSPQHENRLIHETSPYLLQHAHNPVDWFPWCDEAFDRAKSENKPIFLSIGYSACHWCHVMERESFENPTIAQWLNQHFISIKVDREERPDLDDYFMNAVQIMTGRGGWPMSVFLTPDKKPFFGGSYFPPENRHGMPGFLTVLQSLQEIWTEKKGDITRTTQALEERLKTLETLEETDSSLTQEMLHDAIRRLTRAYDERYGGFSGAPKFPQPQRLGLLLDYHWLTGHKQMLNQTLHTLDQMTDGGIHDHIGGGFHRYSVDAQWRVPHFEKMLYDNALLASVYLQAYQITDAWKYAQTAQGIFEYSLKEMRNSHGAFNSAQDADTEGVEGQYYTWTYDELTRLLSEADLDTLKSVYDLPFSGNWEGRIIFTKHRSMEDAAAEKEIPLDDFKRSIQRIRFQLADARIMRTLPAQDDKILCDWNALMITALVKGGFLLKNSRYLDAARHAIDFILTHLTDGDRLFHNMCKDRRGVPGFLSDYAFTIQALLTFHRFTLESDWLPLARQWTDRAMSLFYDESGGFYQTAVESQELPLRLKKPLESVIPSGDAVMVENLLQLAQLTGNETYRHMAEKTLHHYQSMIIQYPDGCAGLLRSFLKSLIPETSLTIHSPIKQKIDDALKDEISHLFWPGLAIIPVYEDVPVTAFHFCHNRSCSKTLDDFNELHVKMKRLKQSVLNEFGGIK